MNIIAVDWGKDARKRSAYISQLVPRTISRLPFGGNLEHLIELSSSLDGPLLIGIGAAIGFPGTPWERLRDCCHTPPQSFAEFLNSAFVPGDFFRPVTKPGEWLPQRPFIRPPSGRWSLKAFNDASDDGLFRKIDLKLHANSLFITSGIPGSVGSGTRGLWQELIALKKSTTFRVWPFHGSLEKLLKGNHPVIAEIYPKACYGIALANSLPAPLLSIAKTKEHARRATIAELRNSRWLARENVTIRDLEFAMVNEDDFDALITAVALTRMFLEEAPLESPETTDNVAEGGVLGSASLEIRVKRVTGKNDAEENVAPKLPPDKISKACPCPIVGCKHVFYNSRGGWDTHVGALSRHPLWHPDVVDPEQRKKLFRREFPNWFK